MVGVEAKLLYVNTKYFHLNDVVVKYKESKLQYSINKYKQNGSKLQTLYTHNNKFVRLQLFQIISAFYVLFSAGNVGNIKYSHIESR